MIRRVIAAVAALLLAGIGIILVLNYANTADERALAGQELVDVLVAAEEVSQGDTGNEAPLEVRQIPQAYVVPGAVKALDEVEGLVAAKGIAAGEQVLESYFVSATELRGAGDFDIPEEAKDLHQLTINLPNPQALGGSVAPGDSVGLFATFELEPPTGWVIGPDGELLWDPDAARSNDTGTDDESNDAGEQGSGEGDNETITFTDLVLDKVLVVRVEGGFVSAVSEEQEEGQAQDTIHVTLALAPRDAARVVQALQTGTVWMTLSPESADEADIDAVVPAAPSQVTGVIE